MRPFRPYAFPYAAMVPPIAVWTPTVLFGGAEDGAWYDPNDLSTVFQERTGAAATTPSTLNDPVGTILDKSGNGFHLTAPSDAARPILRRTVTYYYLEPDGTDDYMITSGGPDLSVDYRHIGAWRPPTTDGRYLWSVAATNDDGVRITSGQLAIGADGPLTMAGVLTPLTNDYVLGVEVNYGNDDDVGEAVGLLLALTKPVIARTSAGWVNGSASDAAATDESQVATSVLALFSSETDQWALGYDGAFFGGLWIDRDLTLAERQQAEAYFASRSGVTLNSDPEEFTTFDDGQPLLAEDGEPIFLEQ